MQRARAKKKPLAKSGQQPGKKKLLPKSKRERRRYVLFEAGENTNFHSLKGALDGAMPAECHARLVKYFPEKGKGILRCRRGTEKEAGKALEAAGMRSLRCSGCVKALRQSI